MAVGCGWQAFVAYVNVGCYYVVGIPLGCLLGFKFNLGAKVHIMPKIFINKLSISLFPFLIIFFFSIYSHKNRFKQQKNCTKKLKNKNKNTSKVYEIKVN